MNNKNNQSGVMSNRELRSLKEIAGDIRNHWKSMDADAEDCVLWFEIIRSVYDRIRCDQGRDYILKFFRLSKEWNDEKARVIKSELQKHLELDIKKYILCYEDGSVMGSYITSIKNIRDWYLFR